MKSSPSSSSRPASYVFPFVSFTFPLGVSSFPFFSQMRWGSGTPDAVQLKTVLPPAGREADCGHCRNSGGAERRSRVRSLL